MKFVCTCVISWNIIIICSAGNPLHNDWAATYPIYIDWDTDPIEVYWLINDILNVHCDLNMAYFPFDKHVCAVQLSTMVSPRTSIHLQPTKLCIKMSLFVSSNEFKVDKVGCSIKVRLLHLFSSVLPLIQIISTFQVPSLRHSK